MPSWVIGSAKACDLVVDQPSVSPRHCRLHRTKEGWLLEDMGSTNGTYIDGHRIPAGKRIPVRPGQQVTLGIDVPIPWPKASSSRAKEGKPKRPGAPATSPRVAKLAAQQRILRIGAAPDNDVVLDQPVVSGHHARLIVAGGQAILEDLESTNGTYVGPERVRIERSPLTASDMVWFGSFQVPAARLLELASASPEPRREPARDGRPAGRPFATVVDRPNTPPPPPSPGPSPGPSAGPSTGPSLPVTQPGQTMRQPVGLSESGVQAYPGISHGPATALRLTGDSMILGRAPGCDHVLDYPMVSGRHARIFRVGGDLYVEDLGSTNGTYVNGTRIHRATQLGPSDVIGLGSFTIRMTGTSSFEQRDLRGDITIEAVHVTMEAPARRLLEDVSLVIHPGEFVGLMGPSGAGKSTLMNVLNGYTPPTHGQVLINGVDLYAHYDRFRGHLGYVPQEDILHRELTAGQALFYTGRLRLPADYSDADIQARVDAVLAQLGLATKRHARIGSGDGKNRLSGGERKRVNLAMELLTDPSVLFLDEPTSGLSSEDTLMVMELLRSLADSGKTILLTIHQPSLEAYRALDNLIIVSRDASSPDPGRLGYYGPAYPDAIHFFNPERPADAGEPKPDEVLGGLKLKPTAEWVQRYRQSSYCQNFVFDRQALAPERSRRSRVLEGRNTPAIAQWWTLLRRTLRVKISDVWNTGILLLQAPIIAFLVVMVFGQKAAGEITSEDGLDVFASAAVTIFVMALSALWFGCSNAAREIVAEWPIYHRERMVNLKIPAYLASKFAVLGLLCVMQCSVLLGIVYWGAGLQGPWLGMFLLLLLASFVGVAIGLLVSSLARTSEVAIAVIPLVILPMLILGGALRPIHEMNPVMRLASVFMPSRWAFEGLLVLESDARPLWEPSDAMKLQARMSRSDPPKERDLAEHYFPTEGDDASRLGALLSLVILLFLLGAFVLGIGGVLYSRDIH